MAPARRFLAVAGIAAFGVCLAIGAFNFVVDPFGVYEAVDLSRFNEWKPEKYTHVRLLKVFQLARIKPRAVVLGTSRTQISIRMSHPGWDAKAGPRYNLAFDGATPHEMYAYLRDAQAIQPLKQVVLGLDTWELDTNPSSVEPGFNADLLDAPGEVWRHALSRLARFGIAFNLETALASLRTIKTQDTDARDWFAPDGQRLGTVFFPTDPAYISSPRTYFLDIDRQEIGFKLDGGPPEPRRPTNTPTRPDLPSLEYVRKIIAFCRAHAIDLRIFITPAHAHQMEISAEVGEWQKIEDGKRALVRMLAADAAGHSDARAFPLWDFSGYSSITTEPLPPHGSRREMNYYWDSSHSRQKVGDWVLDRLFHSQSGAPADFGVELTADNIEDNLARIRAGRDRYRRWHPADIAAIRAMVSDVYGKIPPTRRIPIIGAE